MTESLSLKKTEPQVWRWRDGHGATRERVAFVLVAGLLLALYEDPFSTGILTGAIAGYLRLYAGAAGGVLHLLDHTVHVSGDVIAGRSSVRIVRGCDAAEMMILYGAAVVAAYHSPWVRRAAGLVAGLAVLMIANIARICAMYYLIRDAPSWVDTFHYEVFPLVLVLLALATYVSWRRWFAGPELAAPERVTS